MRHTASPRPRSASWKPSPPTRAAWLLLAALALPATAAAEGLSAEQVADLEKVTAVALSPDGAHVAYVLEVPRGAGDEPGNSYAELWRVPTEGGEARRLVGGKQKVSAPAFSPDGEQLTFLSERPEVAEGRQVYALPAAGGEARPLSRHPTEVRSYAWNADGSALIFTARDAESDEAEAAREKGEDWQVLDADPKYRRLYRLDPESGESRRLFDDDLDVVRFALGPEGTVVFQAAATPRIDDEYMASRLYAVDGAGNGGGSPRPLAETAGKLGPMAVAPGGERFAFLGATSLDDPLAQSLYVAPLDGGAARNLTPSYEGSADDLAWLDDDRLLLLAVEGTKNVFYEVDAGSGRRRPWYWRELIVDDLHCSPSTGLLAVAASAARHPAEVFVDELGKGRPERLSRHNPGLDASKLSRQEVISWRGAEGWTIEGVLTYPAGYRAGRRYPLVLQIHGGPEGVSLDGWRTRPTYPVQVLAGRGYFVLEPNYRGSKGRGVAFSQADHHDLGGTEFEDVLAGVDALVARGLVDPARVATGGWSYGGYFSAWAATRHSERFRAAVVAAGLTNWISFAGTTDIPVEMSTVHWASWWHEKPELHWQRSPLAHLETARTPTLLVHGADDTRVHPEQSLQLYTALRLKGAPTEMVLYPREGHGLDERAHRIDFIERMVAWIDQHLATPRVEGVETTRD